MQYIIKKSLRAVDMLLSIRHLKKQVQYKVDVLNRHYSAVKLKRKD